MSRSWRAPSRPLRGGARFDHQVLDERPGLLSLLIQGTTGDLRPFLSLSGGHRWQRVPPNERRGRVHSSTVTVAALPLEEHIPQTLNPADLAIETMRGSGAGGQHRHATDSAVRIRHLPTGLEVRICAERSQHRNRQIALQLLQAKLSHAESASHHQQQDQLRRALVGTGERSDKVRTLRSKSNEVIDHRTGKRWPLTDFLEGRIA